MQSETSDQLLPYEGTRSEDAEFLRGWKARDAEVGKLQRQKFLLEVKLQQFREDRKKWLDGEDNPVLRERIKELEGQIVQLRQVSAEKSNKIDARNKTIEKLERQLELANQRVSELEASSVQSAKEKPKTPTELFKDSPPPEGYIVIRWDGGTSSNIPPFGFGYGSYKIDDEEIVRLKFQERMSANVAEIKTAMEAIKAVQKRTEGPYKVYITGDSQIALKWIEAAYKRINRKISVKSSPLFQQTVHELRLLLESNYRIADLKCEWKPRKYSVEIFGH